IRTGGSKQMTTGTSSVAVVATSAARTDRRALSQAWYSALHLAGAAAPRPMRAPTPHAAARTPQTAQARPAQNGRRDAPVTREPRRRAGPRTVVPSNAPDPRKETELTRRIELAVVRRSAVRTAVGSAVFATAGGRVQLFVRTDAGATRIVALCPTQLREPVERALAHARVALRASGVPVGAAT
ncbi:MAG: hypothetical protein ABR591_08450, partial [Candidatus Velthaea sp.]